MTTTFVLDVTRAGPSQEQVEKACAAAASGYSISACAASAEVSKRAVEFWLTQGRRALTKLENEEELTASELVYASFAEQFDRARAQGVKALEDVSTERAKEGMGTWSEAITKLERGHRAEFGRQPDVVQSSGPVVIVIENRPARELEPEVIEGELVEPDDDPSALPAAPSATGVS